MNDRCLYSSSLIIILTVLISAGCQSYTAERSAITRAWRSGDFESAVSGVTKQANRNANTKDALLWRLEEGTVHRVANNLLESNEAFDEAESLVNKFEEEAKTRISRETVAMFSNQANLPYRGHAYEKIMMNTYKALNYLQLGESDRARVELNRAFQRQENAVIENQERLEEAVETAEAAEQGDLATDGTVQGYDVERARRDSRFSERTEQLMADIDSRLRPYADYVNPFAVFMDGVYFAHLGVDASDIERARKSFERVASMSPSPYIREDLAMAERIANGEPADAVTYIIFEKGEAPTREEIKIEIPLYLFSTVSYVGAAFPKLKFHRSRIPDLTAQVASGDTYSGELLCSMDSVVAREFKNNWPVVVTKTLISAGVKAATGYAAEKSLEDEDWRIQLFAKALNVTMQSALNQADLRSWSTLPKEFTYIRMETPENGEIDLSAGIWNETVSVEPEKTHIIVVRGINDVAVKKLTQFTL